VSDYDSPWNEALEVYFRFFIAFFFPVINQDIDWDRGYEMLDKELQEIVPESEVGDQVVDKLVKVWRKDGQEEWVLIHVEVQSQSQKDFPRRMLSYNCRIFLRYNREVVSLAILGDDQPSWRPDRFSWDMWGFSLRLLFPVVTLLDYANSVEVLEKDDNPFAVLVLVISRASKRARIPRPGGCGNFESCVVCMSGGGKMSRSGRCSFFWRGSWICRLRSNPYFEKTFLSLRSNSKCHL
jgi:hypothetical protein